MFVRVGERYRVAVRAPMNTAQSKHSVYRRIRRRLGIRQSTLAAWLGITQKAMQYRERCKNVYHLGELLALQEIADLSDAEFIQLLRECA